ncbi:MAG: oligopeptide transporter, OPT family [Lachnospiraceae bacterium]|nr:oligopeptide transporter, OPT family [Lachnospiraceae bacterium]
MKNNNESFKPFIGADKVVPELTAVSVILGIILAVLFGAANAYLGLRVGMTVSASIPAAVISMGVIRVILKRDSILENNMVQTIGSAGESVAAGAIFTLPALFMWMSEWGEGSPSLVEISLIALCGGALGVLFMIPLRQALIVKEHGTLPYPEGTACAEVLLAGEEGGSKASVVFSGMGIAAAYKFIADGLKVFPSDVDYDITSYGGGVGVSVLPALAGVGYICGPKISSYMFSGGIISWLIFMPLIKLFGGALTEPLAPATALISTMTCQEMWGSYIRYIGAGAVAAAGIISLIKSLPLIVNTFKDSMKDLKAGHQASTLRTEQDMPMNIVLILIAALVLIIWLVPSIPVNLVGALLIAVFGFLFATVSSRLVGLVGSSNNPVSGMAIATLLVSAVVLKATSGTGHESMMGVIAIGGVICIIAAIAGDTSQDLKTGFIVGATPKRQQAGELIGVIASALAIGGVLYLLNAAWGYGSDQLPAPQAMIMKTVVEGVMNGNLPWNMIFAGAGIAIVVEILGIPVMPVAVGMYLPIRTTSAIMIGGLVRMWFEKKKMPSEEARKTAINKGVLYTSGMIAGEGLVGILLAVFAIIPMANGSLGDFMGTFLPFHGGKIAGLAAFVILLLLMFKFTVWDKKDE